jgi:hypothetical protein
MTDIPPKQTLYKTAFSPAYNVFVSIEHAHQDADGRWIYTCSSDYSDEQFHGVMFREDALERYCL